MSRQSNQILAALRRSPPVESFGACRYAGKKCKNWEVILGDGLCVQCWDYKAGNNKERQ
jgi:hypothetical protein